MSALSIGIIKKYLTEANNWGFTLVLTLFWIILVPSVSCQNENVDPPVEKVTDYLPLKYDNQWTYTVEGVGIDGQISSISTEKWKVNSGLFIDLFEVSPSGEDYLGYKALFLQDNHEINDLMGTFISLKYLDLPADSLVLIASDSVNFLRERWIMGGLTKVKSSFGGLECICTKTTYHIRGDQEDEYFYFCKDIGICLIEKKYISKDTAGNSQIFFTRKRTLVDYQVD